jgi:hypothetical protein
MTDKDDILTDLKEWLEQLVADKPHRERAGEQPGVEIGRVRRAIEEIERLRAAQAPAPQRLQQQVFAGQAVSGEAANRRHDEHSKKSR